MSNTKKQNYNNRVPGAAGRRANKVVPAVSVDILRGRRNGDPQHQCCTNERKHCYNENINETAKNNINHHNWTTHKKALLLI